MLAMLGRVIRAARKTEGVPLNGPMASAMFAPPPGARVAVSEVTALNISAVWAAVRVITGAVSVLPLHVYRKGVDDAREDAPGSLPAVQLAVNPNPEMVPVTFWETLIAHVLTWGNCYAEIERNGYGDPIALWPIAPNLIRPHRDGRTRQLYYESSVLTAGDRIEPKDILHIPGLGFDGIQGYSVVGMARRSLGLAATAEEAGSAFFGDGMRPGGVLKFPGSLQDLQKMNIEEGVKTKHAGATKFGKALVLYGGLDYQSIGIPPDDAQFLQTREFQNEEVARWFNLPPHKLRDLRRATFSNIEHQGREFLTDTLLYWLTKITQEWGRKLLPADQPGLYAEHTTEALLKGDTPSRYTAYGLGRQWGFLSPNDIRRKENMPPIDGGDVYHVPVNMARMGEEGRPPQSTDDRQGDNPDNRAAAESVVYAIARELADCDAADLHDAAATDEAIRHYLVDHGDSRAWAWVAEAIQTRCLSLTLMTGRPVSPFGIAQAVGQHRVVQVASIIDHQDMKEAARMLASRWRSDVASLVELILDCIGGRDA